MRQEIERRVWSEYEKDGRMRIDEKNGRMSIDEKNGRMRTGVIIITKNGCYPWGEEDVGLLAPVERERREEREEYRDRQLGHHRSQRLQRLKEKEKRQERRMLPHEHPFRSHSREVRRCRSYVRGFLASMNDCVLR